MNSPSALNPSRSLEAVWRAVRASPGAIAGWWAIGIGGGILIYALFYGVAFVAFAGASSQGTDVRALLGGAFLVLALGFGALLFVLQCWWRIGLENALADTLRTGKGRLEDAFSARGRLWSVIATHLLIAVVMALAYLPFLMAMVAVGAVARENDLAGLLLVPVGLVWLVLFAYLGLGFSLAPYAAALEPLGPIEAKARAWKVARGKRLALLLFWIATIVFAMAGFLLLCVGYLATASLLHLMPAEAWLALTHAEERSGWWITTGQAAE